MLQVHSCTMLFWTSIGKLLNLIRQGVSNGISGPDVRRDHVLEGILTVFAAVPFGQRILKPATANMQKVSLEPAGCRRGGN